MDQVLAIKKIQQKINEAFQKDDFNCSEAAAALLHEIANDLNVFLAQGIDYKEVVEALDESIFITDGDGTVLYVNPAYEKNTTIPFEMLKGRNVYDIVSEGKLFNGSATIKVLEKKKRAATLSTIVHSNPPQTGYAVGTPIFGKDGEISQVVVCSRPLYTLRELKNDYKKFLQLVNSENNSQNVKVITSDKDNVMSRYLIGGSEALVDVWKMVRQVASTDATVLITGESGTGKEIVADELYRMGVRGDKPFIKVNCASIPENLLETELFGYEKGAFTGANTSGKKGLFEMANNGTLLLDEIGDMPLSLQVKLLRAIQNKEITRVGGTTPIPLDIRFIASTNNNLLAKVKDGTFRQDLFYRLNVIPINMPPLRERLEDIDMLCEHFAKIYCGRHNRSLTFTPEAFAIMKRYSWPGNIRELENVVEYLTICNTSSTGIDLDMLLTLLSTPDNPIELSMAEEEDQSLANSIEQHEIDRIKAALEQSHNLREAGAILGVNASTVSRKIKQYGIEYKQRK